MARSGARPRFTERRSDGWSAPPPASAPPASAPPASAPPSPEAEQLSPAFAYVPTAIDPEMPLTTALFENQDGSRAGAIVGIEAPPYTAGAIADPGFHRLSNQRTAQLQLADVTPLEIDHLWDWVRSDREGVQNFIGFVPQFSINLFKWIENFLTLEATGAAWFRSVYVAGKLAGFVMLHPVRPTGQLGNVLLGDCHIYLAKEVRGNLPAILPLLMAEADRAIPNVSLRVVTARDDEWAKLLRGVGFVTQIVLTRPAASTGTASGT